MGNDYYDSLQRVNPGYGKPKFSKTELKDILIAVLVLSLAFTILNRKSSSILIFFRKTIGTGGIEYAGLFGLCLVLVTLSFLLHEFGHKFMAQKYGLWSEFRKSIRGLVLTISTSMIGFLFAAPGAVYISGNVDDRMNGHISIAGPIVNIVMMFIGIVGCLLFNHTGWAVFFSMLANLNAFLAMFNLIPVSPLDGSKILRWNKVIWVAVFAVSIAGLLYIQFGMPQLYWR